jgi:hypothetical protein
MTTAATHSAQEIHMKLHVQFFTRSAIEPTKLVEACGDRSVIVYDGRLALRDVTADARTECHKRGYLAFVLRRGDSFTNSRNICSLQYVGDSV